MNPFKALIQLRYCIASALQNLSRNLALSIITTSTISVMFILCTSMLLVLLNLSAFMETWADQLQIIVYFETHAGQEDMDRVTQEIKASALSASNHTFDSLYLRRRFGNDLRTASGANQLQMWFGTIDETTGETNSTVSTEVFDCSIVDFNKNRYLS